MTARVRAATVADAPALAPLFDAYRRFYEQPADEPAALRFLEERLGREESRIFVATDDTPAAVGFTQLYPTFSSIRLGRLWILEDLFVRADARRAGAANALLAAAEQWARETGAVGLILSTAFTNTPAQALYERRGWERDRTFATYTLSFSGG